jgi:hypothetical protein
LKFTNYESKSLVELLMIICEDLIPYYSRHSTDKMIMSYRKADVKVKNEAKEQQQLFPILNNHKSILLAKPQTPKSKRASNRIKKNSSALSHE